MCMQLIKSDYDVMGRLIQRLVELKDEGTNTRV